MCQLFILKAYGGLYAVDAAARYLHNMTDILLCDSNLLSSLSLSLSPNFGSPGQIPVPAFAISVS